MFGLELRPQPIIGCGVNKGPWLASGSCLETDTELVQVKFLFSFGQSTIT